MVESKISDEQYIAKWVAMLNIFQTIIKDEPPIESVKEKLLKLSDAASNTTLLTSAQKRGITERVDNYLNGTYGKGLAKTPH